MKTIKVQLDDSLWERFYRAYPGHGERSAVIRRVVKAILKLEGKNDFAGEVSERVLTKLREDKEEG
jgi:metal-responsive CopG/Arc/MetJ family transcriptional regulator